MSRASDDFRAYLLARDSARLDRRARRAEWDFVARRVSPEDLLADVPTGWRSLVRDLHQRLLRASPFYRLVAVEQRRGDLRVYARFARYASEECEAHVASAIYAARATCAVCAAPGKRRARPAGEIVLCPACCAADRAAAHAHGEWYADMVLDYLMNGDNRAFASETLEAILRRFASDAEKQP